MFLFSLNLFYCVFNRKTPELIHQIRMVSFRAFIFILWKYNNWYFLQCDIMFYIAKIIKNHGQKTKKIYILNQNNLALVKISKIFFSLNKFHVQCPLNWTPFIVVRLRVLIYYKFSLNL